MCIFGYVYVIVAKLLACRTAIDVLELAAANL